MSTSEIALIFAILEKQAEDIEDASR